MDRRALGRGQGRCRRRWLPGLLMLAAALLVGAPDTSARPRRAPAPVTSPPQRRADDLLQSGISALRSGDLARAAQDLSESYRLQPRPAVLFQLGALALAEHQVVSAQDRMRRFLADPTRDPGDTPSATEAARVLALPRGDSSEVRLFGDAGSLVSVDGHPVGVLPLEAPLLLATGVHLLGAELNGARSSVELTVPRGRVLDVRFDQVTGSAAVTPLAMVEIAVAAQGRAAPVRQPLRVLLERLLLQRDLAPPALPPVSEAPVPCPDVSACLAQQARRQGAELALHLEVQPQPAAKPGEESWSVSLALIDPQVGEQAALRTRACTACSLARLGELLPALLSEILAEGRARPSGDLEIRSNPAGAEVALDGKVVGFTPYRRRLWAGQKSYTLRLPDVPDLSEQRGQVVIESGRTAVIEVTLVPRLGASRPPPPVEIRRGKRPLLRIVAGALGTAAGVAMGSFGASALAVSGQCIGSSNPFPAPAPCPRLFETVPIGAGLLGVGLAVTVAGIGVIAWPPPPQVITGPAAP